MPDEMEDVIRASLENLQQLIHGGRGQELHFHDARLDLAAQCPLQSGPFAFDIELRIVGGAGNDSEHAKRWIELEWHRYVIDLQIPHDRCHAGEAQEALLRLIEEELPREIRHASVEVEPESQPCALPPSLGLACLEAVSDLFPEDRSVQTCAKILDLLFDRTIDPPHALTRSADRQYEYLEGLVPDRNRELDRGCGTGGRRKN